MEKVFENLYVGNKYDFYDEENNEEFSFCLCAKTMHQKIAKLDCNDYEGYSGNMPKDNKEYLIAERPDRRLLAVNLIDAPKVEYIPKEIIDKCLDFVEQNTNNGKKVLVVCDQAMSRSAGVAFMYMMKKGVFNDCVNFSDAYRKMQEVYSYTSLGKGMLEYSINYSKDYIPCT